MPFEAPSLHQIQGRGLCRQTLSRRRFDAGAVLVCVGADGRDLAMHFLPARHVQTDSVVLHASSQPNESFTTYLGIGSEHSQPFTGLVVGLDQPAQDLDLGRWWGPELVGGALEVRLVAPKWEGWAVLCKAEGMLQAKMRLQRASPPPINRIEEQVARELLRRAQGSA